MATSKEPPFNRQSSQIRASIPSTPSTSIPGRHAPSRNHAHTVSLGALNPMHRVTRRKSMTSTAMTNVAAIVAAARDREDNSLAVMPSDRKHLPAKIDKNNHMADSFVEERQYTRGCDLYSTSDYQGMSDDMELEDRASSRDLVAVDGLVPIEKHSQSSKSRNRRASEGAHLTKSDGKRVSGELRCEKCGKGYKHSSCLTKHLWEHTPEWSYTSKLLISKHQQVQLLEAASVLVTMNQDPSGPLDPTKATESDHSSASPAASGSSEIQDDDTSSIETSPPPMSEDAFMPENSEIRDSKRYSSNSSIFSRSYQSGPFGSMAASSIPTTSSYGSYRYGGIQRRPSTSGVVASGTSASDDEAGLAAAVELCNFGTPRTGPVHLRPDVPPVPPLPERYQSHNAKLSMGSTGYPMYHHELGLLPTLSHRISDERDVKMHRSHADDDDDDYDQRSISRSRSVEDEEGVFGRMEE